MQTTPNIGVVPIETLTASSGLEFLLGIIEGRFPGPPMADLLGFRLTEIEFGRSMFESAPEFRHYNPLGSVHGGFAATLLDSCMGCAVQSTLPAGVGYTTLEFKISLIRRMSVDTGPVRAEGTILNAGRRIATSEGRLTDAKDRLLAHGTSTCLLFDLPRGDATAPAD